MHVTIVLDLIHVLEYLWKAAHVFYLEGSIEAEGWVTERLLWLLWRRRTATSRGLMAAARKPADTGADYIGGDLDDYWRLHEQRELERNHVTRYANGRIPSLTPPAPASRRKATDRRLRVVK